ncbi:hypothetical protein P389DRAFT_212174 [Cystobasidium minutum MCA 4210]|uniref:uncharacterized protein n=1 Tax=Cystobasidium minutum MCA 4210 TaxID=1397322 RepID=UPI0034CFE202|eukprot:jgi/Rhomi1/212174/estExt_Genemark1.C_60051
MAALTPSTVSDSVFSPTKNTAASDSSLNSLHHDPSDFSTASSSSVTYSDKIVPLNDSTGYTHSTTNAFHDLVAWFSRSVHPTATYTWTLHKGKLATLPGVEMGTQRVDVVFCKPGDPLLQRLPDLGIPVLNAAWIAASMKAGKLLPIATFKLETFDFRKPVQTYEAKNGDLNSGQVENLDSSREVEKDVHIISVKSTPMPEVQSIVPATPESFHSQDKLIPPSVVARRASILSPKRSSKSVQTDQASTHKPKKFVCSGTCPELLCPHRPELAIPRSSLHRQKVANFANLTGISPRPRRQSQYEVPKLSAQSTVHPQHTALPSAFSTGSKLDTRLAKIKSDIEVFKSPKSTVANPAVKVESPSVPRLSLDPPRVESRSSSSSAASDRSGNPEHGPVASTSRQSRQMEHYRKQYGAPSIHPDEPEEDPRLQVSRQPAVQSNLTMESPKEEDAEGYPKYPPTPISLKRKAEDQSFESSIPSSPTRPSKRFRA